MIYRRSYPREDESGHVGSFLAGCLTGMLIGAALGVLMAPHRGEITRRKIARRAGETKDQVKEAVEELMEERAAKKEEEEEEEES